MRKVLFLMFLLLLMGLGAAGVKAQVRIGGNTPPNPAAALDLNAAEGTTTGTKGLALPRVTLSSDTATLDGTTANIPGMLVYNTGSNLSAAVYYWDGSKWVSQGHLLIDSVLPPPIRNGAMLVASGTHWVQLVDSTRLLLHCQTCPQVWTALATPTGCVGPMTVVYDHGGGGNVCTVNLSVPTGYYYCLGTNATNLYVRCLMAP